MGQSLHVHVVVDKVGKVGQTDAKDAGYHVICTLSFEQWRTIEDFNKQCCRQTSDQGPHWLASRASLCELWEGPSSCPLVTALCRDKRLVQQSRARASGKVLTAGSPHAPLHWAPL